ncbi:hypothetical protein TKK_0004509 [Trichogramma kaykai]|uniref:RING-type domain-containing protein n=1 Tax=Trichogramma kaykai TaxID=54128 RepID=A0ABD2XLT1_9HYME
MYDGIFEDFERLKAHINKNGSVAYEASALFELLEDLYPVHGSEQSMQIIAEMYDLQSIRDSSQLPSTTKDEAASNDKSIIDDDIIEIAVPKKHHPVIDLTENSPEPSNEVAVTPPLEEIPSTSMNQTSGENSDANKNSDEESENSDTSDDDLGMLDFESNDWDFGNDFTIPITAPPLLEELEQYREGNQQNSNESDGNQQNSNESDGNQRISVSNEVPEILEENNNDPNNNFNNQINEDNEYQNFMDDLYRTPEYSEEPLKLLMNDQPSTSSENLNKIIKQEISKPGCSTHDSERFDNNSFDSMPNSYMHIPGSSSKQNHEIDEAVPGCSKNLNDTFDEQHSDNSILQDIECIKEIIPWAQDDMIQKLLKRNMHSPDRKQRTLLKLVKHNPKNEEAIKKRKVEDDSYKSYHKLPKFETNKTNKEDSMITSSSAPAHYTCSIMSRDPSRHSYVHPSSSKSDLSKSFEMPMHSKVNANSYMPYSNSNKYVPLKLKSSKSNYQNNTDVVRQYAPLPSRNSVKIKNETIVSGSLLAPSQDAVAMPAGITVNDTKPNFIEVLANTPQIIHINQTKETDSRLDVNKTSPIKPAKLNYRPIIPVSIPDSNPVPKKNMLRPSLFGSSSRCDDDVIIYRRPFPTNSNNQVQDLRLHEDNSTGNCVQFLPEPVRLKIDNNVPSTSSAKEPSKEYDIKIYNHLRSIFPDVESNYIKQIAKIPEGPDQNRDKTLNDLIDHLLQVGPQYTRQKVEYIPVPAVHASIDEQYDYLLGIFPDADPTYLRHFVETNNNKEHAVQEFVQSKLETRDYPTKEQYLAKIKITEQQKQYTTDFKVEKFLEVIPDPISYFENPSRKCTHDPIGKEFLKHIFNKNKVHTISRVYSSSNYNMSITAASLSELGPDMRSKRASSDMPTENIPLLQEMAYIKHKDAIKLHIENLRITEERLFKDLKEKNLLVTCQCCYNDECMPSKCALCNEGHTFCNDCVIRGTDSILADGGTHVQCFTECSSEFSLSTLQKVLKPTKFSALLTKRQLAEVMAAGVDGLVSCPFCHFASIPPPEDKVFRCLNPECMKETCRLCKELNHIPLKCDEVIKKDKALRILEEKMTQALIRTCQNCKRQFYKEDGGCNKMSCVCGALQCYVCDQLIKGYDHFNSQGSRNTDKCPLWTDDRRMHAEGVRKVAEDLKKNLQKMNPNLQIDTEKLLPKLPPKVRGPHDDIPNSNVLPEHVRRIAESRILPP